MIISELNSTTSEDSVKNVNNLQSDGNMHTNDKDQQKQNEYSTTKKKITS